MNPNLRDFNLVPGAPCKLCLATNPSVARTQIIGLCCLLEASSQIISAAQVLDVEDN